MPRISFIFRTDTHVADKNPSSWKGDYVAEIWESLRQVGQLAKAHQVSAVLDGGDYFHVKTANRNSHGSIIQTASIHSAYPCPVHCVEGNHDLQYNNLDSISRQPLGVLYAANVFKHLREEVFQDGPFQVRVVGVPYHPRRAREDLLAIQKKPGDDFLVAIVHALAAENPPPKVEEFFGEPVFRYADLVTPDGPDVWAFGHWHRDQGVVNVGGKHFVNQGAVSRGSLTHENTARTPQVSLIEFEGAGPRIKTIPLIVAPAADVFDMERKERAEQESRSMDSFLERLQEDQGFDPSLSIDDNIRTLDFAAEVRDLALAYLAQAREG